MKPSSESNQRFFDDWTLTGPMPDLFYFKKLVKRHYKFVILSLILVQAITVTVPFLVTNTYQSNIHGIFDPNDIAASGYGSTRRLSYDMMARLFQARFQSQQFLYDISQTEAGQQILSKEGFSVWELVGLIKELVLQSNVGGEDIDGQACLSPQMLKKARQIAKIIAVDTNQGQGILALQTLADSPELAAQLADQTMELFIQTEIQDQIERTTKQLDFLKESIRNLSYMPDDSAEDNKDTSDGTGSALKRLEITEQARELNEKLDLLNRELLNNQSEQATIKKNYESELAKLLTELQPNHPVVLARKQDFATKSSFLDQQAKKLQSQIDNVRRQIWRIRALKVSNDESPITNPGVDPYQGAFFIGLSDRIKDLTLELRNLRQQLLEPEKRTRLRVLFPATIESKAFKSRRKQAAIMTLALGLMFVFGSVILRELRNPVARDDWRIERATNQPILAQVSEQSLSQFKRITPEDADQLRESLAAREPNELSMRTILSYRRLELATDKHCKGKIILLSAAGPSDQLGETIYNFLNIYCTDTDQRCLLFDFNQHDPVVANYNPADTDFIDVVRGQALWPDIIVSKGGDNIFTEFDFIPPSQNLIGIRSRAITKQQLHEAISKLSEDYDKIFLRSFPEYQFIENTGLMTVASDCIVCVDARKTLFQDLDRTMVHLDSEKIRGLMIIGT